MINQKLIQLKNLIETYKRPLVAFSGGLDSTLLLKIVSQVKKDFSAIIFTDGIHHDFETNLAIDILKDWNINYYKFSSIDLFDNQLFCSNPDNKCYICKKFIFEKTLDFAKENNFSDVLEGTNYSDLSLHRPGYKAIKELGIKSPLLESKFTKSEIRTLAKELNISNWNKASFTCIATRFSNNSTITIELVNKLKEIETILHNYNLENFRARYDNNNIKIEISSNDFNLFFKSDIRSKLIAKSKELGFNKITLDLEEYRES